MPVRNASFFIVVLAVAGISLAADNAPTAKPIRIVLVGDSTVASYTKPPADKPDLTGWGQVFGEFFNGHVTVLNHARSGRSTKSFMREGLWKKALADKGDYIFIQFGHNDSHLIDGKPAVDPATDFKDFLRQYIDEARAAGARPVLVTPVARRTFKGGKIQTTLQPYADAMFKVGKEKGVPVIDLHAAAMRMFDRLGDDGSADLTASASDRTHFSRKGARTMAQLVAEGLPAAIPELRPYLRAEAKPVP
jgi:lysophospholipase L1-like esterase